MVFEEYKPISTNALNRFVLERVLNEDPLAHTMTLLGTLPTSDTGSTSAAILRLENLALTQETVQNLPSLLRDVKPVGSTDIYTWLFAWLYRDETFPDIKINVIFPATEVHIKKYGAQTTHMIHETPHMFKRIVLPYIEAFPPSRTQWVEDILSGKSEAEKVLFKDDSLTGGYIILPDMKWDLSNISALYLIAITTSRGIRCLRDLRKQHLPMLRGIHKQASRVVYKKWGLKPENLRFYIHYQPSYYHFHVHIVNSNYVGFAGMGVGQAHLLEDVISMLECDPDIPGPTIFERLTLTYGLGERHGLFEGMMAAQKEIIDD